MGSCCSVASGTVVAGGGGTESPRPGKRRGATSAGAAGTAGSGDGDGNGDDGGGRTSGARSHRKSIDKASVYELLQHQHDRGESGDEDSRSTAEYTLPPPPAVLASSGAAAAAMCKECVISILVDRSEASTVASYTWFEKLAAKYLPFRIRTSFRPGPYHVPMLTNQVLKRYIYNVFLRGIVRCCCCCCVCVPLQRIACSALILALFTGFSFYIAAAYGALRRGGGVH